MDERFYHLDTCFCPLSDGTLLYYPPAFDFYSNRLIETRVPTAKRLVVGEADALAFACNAVNVGRSVILNQVSAGLRQQLQTRGYDVVETPLSEFLKAGGAAKCLTLRLDEPRLLTATATGADGPQTGAGLEHQGRPQASLNRTIRLQGHLLDSGLINRALDRIVEGGGSFQVLDFALGQQRHSTSSAAIRVSAPDGEVMADLMARLIALGALATADGECDAALAEVLQDGVAPDDFTSAPSIPPRCGWRAAGIGWGGNAWMGPWC